jgi:predicted nucleic acid-binding protein
MNAKEFVDTNILVYSFDLSAGPKREIAFGLIERLARERTGCLSVQVLQEFYVTMTKKLSMPPDDAARQIERFGYWTIHRPGVSDVLAACKTHREHHVSFWDAMVVESASRLGCRILWSEDLSDGGKWQAVTVLNPFARTTVALDPG